MVHERYINRQLYFNEMRLTTERYVIPWLERHIKVDGIRVLEVGCGEGGNLPPFLGSGCEVVGVDRLQKRIEQCKHYISDVVDMKNITLIKSDIMNLKVDEIGTFDLIILKDFIEHIEQRSFLLHIHTFLNVNGRIFLGFPPWQMPFGGHQQVCQNKLSRLPWIHLLPRPFYLGYLKLMGESPELIENMVENIRTGISIGQLRRIFKETGYSIIAEQQFLINPGYKAKFGLRPRRQIRLISKIPFLRNFFSTCCYMLVSKP